MASVRIVHQILQKKYLISPSVSNVYLSYTINFTSCIKQNRHYSSKKSVTKVDPIETNNKVQLNVVDYVKENTKSAGYLFIILGGVGVTAFMFYAILSELFSSNSPNGIYARALKLCKENTNVLDLLGEPIKSFGEETRRGRRNHLQYSYYTINNKKRMLMRFHVKGTRRQATVSVETEELPSGKYDFRYIYVRTTIGGEVTDLKILDNRPDMEPQSMYSKPPYQLN